MWCLLIMAILLLLLQTSLAAPNGLALTPQMGWNSWNHFACNISETTIKQAADAMISSGLSKVGYNYINIDDCWSEYNRSAQGKLVPDQTRFPNGIASLADYIHNLGLKIGIYSDAGSHTCQYRPGSLNYEQIDANTWASWEIDYLKYDNCYNQDVSTAVRYPAMAEALLNSGRDIFYSICNWGQNNTASWAPAIGNSWRTTQDIKDFWVSVELNFRLNSANPQAAGPGGWNDPDMLQVGNGGLSFEEYKAHFTLWALVKAPLLIGCDMTSMSNETLTILSNKEVIDINQDALGKQGTCYANCDEANKILHLTPEVWACDLSDGSMAVVVMNWNLLSKSYQLSASADLKKTKTKMTIRDLWEHKDLGTFEGIYNIHSLGGHSQRAFKINFSQ